MFMYAMCANLCLIVTLLLNPKQLIKSENKCYILSLSVTDLLSLIIYFPGKIGLSLCVICWSNQMHIWLAFYRTVSYSSTMLLCAMSLNRWYSISQPYNVDVADRPWLIPLVVFSSCWTASALICFPYDLLPNSAYKVYGTYVFVGVFAGGGTMFLIATSIGIAHRIYIIQRDLPRTTNVRHIRRARINTARLIIMLGAIWIVFSLPGNIYYVASEAHKLTYNKPLNLSRLQRTMVAVSVLIASLVPLALNPTSVFVLSSGIRQTFFRNIRRAYDVLPERHSPVPNAEEHDGAHAALQGEEHGEHDDAHVALQGEEQGDPV